MGIAAQLADLLPDLSEVPADYVDEAILQTFLHWTQERGISLYPAQEEAATALVAEDNVILATPTGSGKSMVAKAAHFIALARGQRSIYTAPIKALVSEKFFDLCATFGPENVGMMTGDATVNAQAPIICATAEILAHIALRDGADAPFQQVVMDEFHYYSEPSRGWAWQVPLLELPHAQFLLMSATLGDTEWLSDDLSSRTGRTTTLVAGSERPVPLEFSYVYTPIHDTISDLLDAGLAPIYVVHFSQRDAAERAQALTSLKLVDAERAAAIAEAIAGFRFTSAFGRVLSRLLKHGIGVHHGGMLPKYRRLVERLAQEGLLPVICGTDTLGVGINVPIRTVVLTELTKFDGVRRRVLKSREFHQIAGRAGRAGFDTQGTVVVEAPEHEIENVKLRKRAGQDPAKLKKMRKKSAPAGRATWTESTFERLTTAEPEQLSSQFQITSGMIMNVINREQWTYGALRHLLRSCHESRANQNALIRTAIDLYRGLVQAEIVEEYDDPSTPSGRNARLTKDLRSDFALNQPLSPFAVAALELLDPESSTFTLDIISTFEAVLDSPQQILRAQQNAERSRVYAELVAEGVDHLERRAILDEITHPQPLAESLADAYDTYAAAHPWARDFSLAPKSVLRDMIERAMTFSDVVSTYGLTRVEGEVLRYLTDAWRTLSHSVPADYVTEELEDILTWLAETIRQVDSSLLDEWTALSNPDAPLTEEEVLEVGFGVSDPTAFTANRKAFSRSVRNLFFRFVELFAFEEEEALAAAQDAALEYVEQEGSAALEAEERPSRVEWPDALDAYFDEYADLGIDADARSGRFLRIDEQVEGNARLWRVRQTFADPEGDHGFALEGIVDLDACDARGEVQLAELRFIEG